MPVLLTGVGGLFTRLGKLAKVARSVNTYQQTTLPAVVEEVMATFDGLRFVVDGLPTALPGSQSAAGGILGSLSVESQQTLQEMVRLDAPVRGGTVTDALNELIFQMTGTARVTACVVTAASTAFATNSGNGVLLLGTRRGDGRDQENLVAEIGRLACTVDSQTGGQSPGQEQFLFTGAPAVQDPWSPLWPGGSGVSTALSAVDGSQSGQPSGNVLTNTFETFTSNLPDRWVAAVGVAGTDFQRGTTALAGTASLQFLPVATLTSLTQTIGDPTAGTPVALRPLTQYGINFWLFCSGLPGAGILTVDLVDGSGVVLTDAQSVANSFTVSLPALTAGSWVARNGIFRTPRVLPSTVRLRLRISTALTTNSVFVDRLALTPMVPLYAGGPQAAIFSGATPFIVNDGWSVTTTNNRGGSTLNSTFQAYFDRVFGMRQLELLLPTTGGTAIADALITA